MNLTYLPSLGQVFYLVHKISNKCLAPKTNDTFQKDSLVLQKIQQQNLNQLWMVEEVSPGKCQITHMKSCLNLDQKNMCLYLNRNKCEKESQKWVINKVSEDSSSILVRKTNSKIAIFYNGLFSLGVLDPENEFFHFEFRMTKTPYLDTSCMITSVYSGKTLDVYYCLKDKGNKIIQYQPHKHTNQRWNLIRIGNVFAIKSLFSGLFLDIKDEKKTAGTKIIQWSNNHKSTQIWRLEEEGDGTYIISSVADSSLILCIQKNSLENFGCLVLGKRENPYYWKIQGEIPRLFE